MQPNMRMLQQMQNRIQKIQEELGETLVEGTAGGGMVTVQVTGLKAVAGIKVQTLQYGTYPVYANEGTRVTGWRARQSLRLEGRDAQAVGELVATLQEQLAVESIGQAVSREARTAAEEALTPNALAQFDARAKQVAAALGRPGYRLVRINVSTTGNPGMPVVYRGAMMADMAMKAAPAQVEAGEQTLGVTVSGTIQLEAAR